MERYCFDTSVLVYFFSTKHDSGNDHIQYKKARLENFLAECRKNNHEVLIPTPVLSELLVGVDEAAMPDVIGALKSHQSVQIVSYDETTAIEYALIFPEQLELFKSTGVSKQVMKFDSMILAMCSRFQVTCLLTGDNSMANKARQKGIQVKRIEDLPVPDEARQGMFDM